MKEKKLHELVARLMTVASPIARELAVELQEDLDRKRFRKTKYKEIGIRLLFALAGGFIQWLFSIL
jgi:hypothetical protein